MVQAIEAAGATIINTGIGWYLARNSLTHRHAVPRGAFTWVTRKLKGHVSLPLVTTNRIKERSGRLPTTFSRGDADMVSMARPFLADAELLSKAQSGEPMRSTPALAAIRPASIHFVLNKVTSCLVNPRACHETKMPILPAVQKKKSGGGRCGTCWAGVCH